MLLSFFMLKDKYHLSVTTHWHCLWLQHLLWPELEPAAIFRLIIRDYIKSKNSQPIYKYLLSINHSDKQCLNRLSSFFLLKYGKKINVKNLVIPWNRAIQQKGTVFDLLGTILFCIERNEKSSCCWRYNQNDTSLKYLFWKSSQINICKLNHDNWTYFLVGLRYFAAHSSTFFSPNKLVKGNWVGNKSVECANS